MIFYFRDISDKHIPTNQISSFVPYSTKSSRQNDSSMAQSFSIFFFFIFILREKAGQNVVTQQKKFQVTDLKQSAGR